MAGKTIAGVGLKNAASIIKPPAEMYRERCSICPLYTEIEDYLIANGLNYVHVDGISDSVERYCNWCVPGTFERYKKICKMIYLVEERCLKEGPERAREFMRSLLDSGTSLSDERKERWVDMFDFDRLSFLEEPLHGF
jgi:hypothetical protein